MEAVCLRGSDIIDIMASLLIRDIPESVKTNLRLRAARNGRSMAAEARDILATGLKATPRTGADLVEAMRRCFAGTGGFDLQLPPRDLPRDPPDFTK